MFLGRRFGSNVFDLSWPFGGNGFLKSKHADKKLKDLLERCANPTNAKDGTRLSAPDNIKVALYKALEETVSFMND